MAQNSWSVTLDKTYIQCEVCYSKHLPEYDVRCSRNVNSKVVSHYPVWPWSHIISFGTTRYSSFQIPLYRLKEILFIVSTHWHNHLGAGLNRVIYVYMYECINKYIFIWVQVCTENTMSACTPLLVGICSHNYRSVQRVLWTHMYINKYIFIWVHVWTGCIMSVHVY